MLRTRTALKVFRSPLTLIIEPPSVCKVNLPYPLLIAFPAKNPSVYEVYWSSAQIRARTHLRLLSTHRFLLSLFSPAPASSSIDLGSPVIYADRVRIRPPGDTGFSLGPHVDAGSVERWEDPTYASVYGHTFGAGSGSAIRHFPVMGLQLGKRHNWTCTMVPELVPCCDFGKGGYPSPILPPERAL